MTSRGEICRQKALNLKNVEDVQRKGTEAEKAGKKTDLISREDTKSSTNKAKEILKTISNPLSKVFKKNKSKNDQSTLPSFPKNIMEEKKGGKSDQREESIESSSSSPDFSP